MNASEKVARARTQIVLDHPFFASLLLSMPCIEDTSIPTACTNGVVIKYNPTFVVSLTQSQVAGLLVHEILHPALGHLHRLPRNMQGNIAGDFAINNFLDDYNNSAGINRLDLPEGGCIDHKYDGMSAEQILAALSHSPEQPEGVGGEGDDESKGNQRTREQGGWGEFENQAGSPDGKTSGQDMGAEWERRVVQAATAAKMQGTVPTCIEQLVDKLVNPKVPWQQLLERFIEQTSFTDYSWDRPDRRFLPDDIVIPDLHDETLGEIVVAIDTSGSIYGCPEMLAAFVTEVNSLTARCNPSKLTLLHCDAAIQKVDEFFPGQLITVIPKGGGGTDFRPVGEYIAQHNINPRVVVYLTDLYGEFPTHEWPFPTIWCVYGNTDSAPFGDTVHIN